MLDLFRKPKFSRSMKFLQIVRGNFYSKNIQFFRYFLVHIKKTEIINGVIS